MDAPAYNESHSLELMIGDLQEKAVTEYRLKKNATNSSEKATPNENNVLDEKADSNGIFEFHSGNNSIM